MKCKICGYTWDTGDGGHDCWQVVKGERDALREAIQGTIDDLDDANTTFTPYVLQRRREILQKLLGHEYTESISFPCAKSWNAFTVTTTPSGISKPRDPHLAKE